MADSSTTASTPSPLPPLDTAGREENNKSNAHLALLNNVCKAKALYIKENCGLKVLVTMSRGLKDDDGTHLFMRVLILGAD